MFKTSFEIDQRWLVELAADRTPYIDQAQSLNLFIPADVDKWDLHQLHMMAWERGVKIALLLPLAVASSAPTTSPARRSSRAARRPCSLNAQRLDAPSVPIGTPPAPAQPNDYEECLSCQ